MPFGTKDPLAMERIQAPLSQAVQRYLQVESSKRAFAHDLLERDFVSGVMEEYGGPGKRSKEEEYKAATTAIARLSSYGGPRATLAAQMLAKNLDVYSKLFPERAPRNLQIQWTSPDEKPKIIKQNGILMKEEVGMDVATGKRIPGMVRHQKVDDLTSLVGGGGDGDLVNGKPLRDYFQYEGDKVVGMGLDKNGKPIPIDANTRNKLTQQALKMQDAALRGITQAQAARTGFAQSDVAGQASVDAVVSDWKKRMNKATEYMNALQAYSSGDKKRYSDAPTPATKTLTPGQRLLRKQ